MALNIKHGLLAVHLQFTRIGTSGKETKLCKPGKAVQYMRSPADLGMFAIFTDSSMKWYAKVDAKDIATYVNEKE